MVCRYSCKNKVMDPRGKSDIGSNPDNGDDDEWIVHPVKKRNRLFILFPNLSYLYSFNIIVHMDRNIK